MNEYSTIGCDEDENNDDLENLLQSEENPSSITLMGFGTDDTPFWLIINNKLWRNV